MVSRSGQAVKAVPSEVGLEVAVVSSPFSRRHPSHPSTRPAPRVIRLPRHCVRFSYLPANAQGARRRSTRLRVLRGSDDVGGWKTEPREGPFHTRPCLCQCGGMGTTCGATSFLSPLVAVVQCANVQRAVAGCEMQESRRASLDRFRRCQRLASQSRADHPSTPRSPPCSPPSSFPSTPRARASLQGSSSAT